MRASEFPQPIDGLSDFIRRLGSPIERVGGIEHAPHAAPRGVGHDHLASDAALARLAGSGGQHHLVDHEDQKRNFADDLKIAEPADEFLGDRDRLGNQHLVLLLVPVARDHDFIPTKAAARAAAVRDHHSICPVDDSTPVHAQILACGISSAALEDLATFLGACLGALLFAGYLFGDFI